MCLTYYIHIRAKLFEQSKARLSTSFFPNNGEIQVNTNCDSNLDLRLSMNETGSLRWSNDLIAWHSNLKLPNSNHGKRGREKLLVLNLNYFFHFVHLHTQGRSDSHLKIDDEIENCLYCILRRPKISWLLFQKSLKNSSFSVVSWFSDT